jgi:AcrR family transcriptional regulator
VAETAPRLPRGRHRLSREQVAADQRARLMLALADAMGERGYVATTVADVLARAGVSRQTFYEQFASKLDCFLATFDAAGELLLAALGEVAADGGPPEDRFDRLFTRYLDVLAEALPYARVLLVEVYAAGPEAVARRSALQRTISDGVADVLGADDADARFACQVLVAAVGSMVTEPLLAGDPDAVRALRAPVLALVARALTR